MREAVREAMEALSLALIYAEDGAFASAAEMALQAAERLRALHAERLAALGQITARSPADAAGPEGR